ncbi:MAG: hypothetical protein AAF901_02525 [Bacteroidota bacterium]
MVTKEQILKLFFIYILCALNFSCATTKNLYDEKIDAKNATHYESSKLLFDGYYYILNSENKIKFIVLFNNGSILHSGFYDFDSFGAFEEDLLSTEFTELLRIHKKTDLGVFVLKDNTLIAQFEIGSNVSMGKHFINTSIFEMKSKGSLLLVKNYGDEIRDMSVDYAYKQFKEIEALKSRILN